MDAERMNELDIPIQSFFSTLVAFASRSSVTDVLLNKKMENIGI